MLVNFFKNEWRRVFNGAASTTGEISPDRPSAGKRSFHAAQVNHLTSSWTTTSRSMDSDLRNDLVTIRSRSRALAKDNDYLKHFLSMVQVNVVGHTGFTLQMRVEDANGKADLVANRAIEKAFKKWCKRKNCDITGKLSFNAMCRLIVRTVARDGEALVRKVRGRSLNDFGFSLQLLAIDRLDTTKNETWSNGNVIRMGVEIDSFGRPVAYHLLTTHPGDGVYRSVTGKMHERVPASDLIHLYLQDDPEQSRGFPWAHTAMTRLNHLGAFDEAAVIAARIGASKMGWYKRSDQGGPVIPGQDGSEQSYFIQEASPGEFGVLPDGYDFVQFNPDYPHANYDPFTKACLRGIASGLGLGVNYNTLSNNLEGVNYTSLRSGTLTERDAWMVLQEWFCDGFLEDLIEDWLRTSLLMSAIVLPNGTPLPANKFEKFNAAEFQGRRWQWVDPLKDLQACVLAINNKLANYSQVYAEKGNDFTDTIQGLSAELKAMADLGLSITATPPPKEKDKENEDENSD